MVATLKASHHRGKHFSYLSEESKRGVVAEDPRMRTCSRADYDGCLYHQFYGRLEDEGVARANRYHPASII